MHEEFDSSKDTKWTRNVPHGRWVKRAYRLAYQTHGPKVAQQAIYNLMQALACFTEFPETGNIDAVYFTGEAGLGDEWLHHDAWA